MNSELRLNGHPAAEGEHRPMIKTVTLLVEPNGQSENAVFANGSGSPLAVLPGGQPLNHHNATDLLEGLSSSELSNLFSKDDVIPPTSSEQISAWVLASQAIHVLDNARSPGGNTAKLISTRAGTALETALRPLLQPSPDTKLARDDLPSPRAVRAMASLAAQAALWAEDDGALPAATMEVLLQTAEQCTALGADLGPREPAGQYALQLALAVSRNLKILMGRYPCSPHVVIEDAVARMHLLLMASASLAEQEWAPVGDSTQNECSKKVNELWSWDLSRPVDENGALMEERPALSLTRVWTEAAAVLLGAAWCAQPAEVRSAFLPLATASSEKEGVLLLLGRLLAVVGGEESASRLLIPMVTDTLAAKSGEVDAGVYGVAAHVLASMAVTSAASNTMWGYTQVVDLLIKLYKFPQFSISGALLYGSAVPPPISAPGNGSLTEPSVEVHIPGRCPGALANALTSLATGLGHTSAQYRKDLRKRLLALFSDFALIMPNESFVRDLGALLPAVAASLQGMQDQRHDSRRSSRAYSSGDLSLDALSSMQEEGRTLHAALRHLWLQSSVYDFADLSNNKGRKFFSAWPEEWATALCTIAASTPALLLGSEQQKVEAFLEDAAAEYGSWLGKLEKRGEAGKLMSCIMSVISTPPGAYPLPAPLAAHILTIAYKAVAEVTFQHTGHSADSCPLEPVLIHMQVSQVTSQEYPWLKEILTKAFVIQIKRLATLTKSNDNLDAAYAESAAGTTAEILTAALSSSGPNQDVPKTAFTLVKTLIDSFPALLFSSRVFAAALHAVAESEGVSGTLTSHQERPIDNSPTHSLPREHMIRLVHHAAVIAPGPAEALALEMVRHLSNRGARYASVAMQFAAQVMQSLHSGRQECFLPDISGSFKGLVAWSVKLHALGVVTGLSAAEEDGNSPTSGGVVARCARVLLSSLRDGATDKMLVGRMVEAAAAVVSDDLNPAVSPVLRLLAWTPLSRFIPEVMSASIMVWLWLLAVGDGPTKAALMDDISAAWAASIDQRIGLFDLVNGRKESRRSTMTISDDVSVQLAAIRAHHAWVVFLTEVWQSQRHDRSPGCLSLRGSIGRILDASLGGIDESPLSLHPAAIGARFRLLHLALSYICAADRPTPELPDSSHQMHFYRRVVLTALQTFNTSVSWYESDRETLREAAAAVRDFSSLLRQAPSLVIAAADEPKDPTVEALKKLMEGHATKLLLFLLPIEIERLSLWADPVNFDTSLRALGRNGTLSAADWARLIASAWSLSPRLALALGSRFAGIPAVGDELQRLVTRSAADSAVHALPEAARYLTTPKNTKANSPVLGYLASWAPVDLLQAMSIIASPAGRHPLVVAYVIRSLDACDPEQLSFFLPQLVQLLRHDPDGTLESFLVKTSCGSVYFAYLLVCQLDSEGTPPDEAFNPAVKRSNWSPPMDTGLWNIADRVRERVWEQLPSHVKEKLSAQIKFFSDITDISGKLYPVPKEERKAAAVKFVAEVTVPRNDLFMPTDLHAKIVKPKPESGTPMQSAAKCPILVAFDVEKELPEGQGTLPAVEAAIFKVGDDCRQDVLALQVISLLKQQFDAAAMKLPLVPYGVIPTGHECGIIEVVQHAKSRAQLGELTDGGLLEVFQREFGLPGSTRFEAARSAFIASSAAYAVASYLLQAKDRHNGNIMLDNRGRIIHIDFGFILGISPGGNMGFESAAFKLSYEMTELLDPGNTRTSPHFLKFQELCVKGYLAARSAADGIVATVAMSEASKLPCFSRGATVESLRQRFHLEMSDAQAAEFMRGLIADAYDKWTTGVYDLIQFYQNKIPK